MQFYQGPLRRVLRRYSDQTSFTIDGLVDQEEERGLFVKQSFNLQQFRNADDEAYYNMSNVWTFPYELDFAIPPGGRVPFQSDHTITDRLLLNKSFNNVLFRPDNCNNFVSIDTRAQTRLAPLLCTDLSYVNVTRPPRVSSNVSGHAHQRVDVQMGDYNRVWFGAVTDMTARAQVTNREGDAPYTCADADITYGAGDHPEIPAVEGGAVAVPRVGNREIYTAYGFELSKIPTPQLLRPDEENIMLGKPGRVHGQEGGGGDCVALRFRERSILLEFV